MNLKILGCILLSLFSVKSFCAEGFGVIRSGPLIDTRGSSEVLFASEFGINFETHWDLSFSPLYAFNQNVTTLYLPLALRWNVLPLDRSGFFIEASGGYAHTSRTSGGVGAGLGYRVHFRNEGLSLEASLNALSAIDTYVSATVGLRFNLGNISFDWIKALGVAADTANHNLHDKDSDPLNPIYK